MKKNIIITVVIIIILYSMAKVLSPGSYLDAEEFEFKANEKAVIKAVEIFKQNNPKYSIPSEYGIRDGRKDSNDYWHHIYFFFPEDSSIANAWIRQAGFEPTIVALVSIKLNNANLEWMEINTDFSRAENRRQILRFEKEIIEPLHKIIQDK